MGDEIILSEDQSSSETLVILLEQVNEHLEQVHQDAEILIASSWLLCGIVIGVAVGQLFYQLWRS